MPLPVDRAVPVVDLTADVIPRSLAGAVIDLAGGDVSPPPRAFGAAAGKRRAREAAGSSFSPAGAGVDLLSLLHCPICFDSYAAPPPSASRAPASAPLPPSSSSSSAAAAAGSPASAGSQLVVSLCGHHAHRSCATAWLAKQPTCFKCAGPLPGALKIHPLFLG